ncbi:unnamed protein product, partial [Leptidea sinapis]
VAIVLALVGISIAQPTPLGLGLTGLAHGPLQPAGVITSSFVNHGVTLPRAVPIVTPLVIQPIPSYSVPVLSNYYGYSH